MGVRELLRGVDVFTSARENEMELSQDLRIHFGVQSMIYR